MTLIPVQVTFHGLAHSAEIEADIRERVAWLAKPRKNRSPQATRPHGQLPLEAFDSRSDRRQLWKRPDTGCASRYP